MTETKGNAKRLMTPVGRGSFVRLAQPDDNGDYTMSLIIDPATYSESDKAKLLAIVQLVEEAKDAKFPDKKGKVIPNFKTPIKKGNAETFDLDKYPEYKDKIILNLRSKKRPVGVVDANKQVIPPDRIAQECYSGAYFIAFVTAYAYDHPQGGKGVSLGLQSVMKVKDGDPLGSVSDPVGDFEEVDVSEFVNNSAAFVDLGI